MKQVIFDTLMEAQGWFQAQDTSKWPEGVSYSMLTGTYSNGSNPSAETCEKFQCSFFASRTTRRRSEVNQPGHKPEIVLTFTQTPLGDLVFTVKFCGQIKFSGFHDANSVWLGVWVEDAIRATFNYAVALNSFINLSA